MKFLLHLLDRRPHLQSTLWIQGWVGTFLGETQPRQTYADDHTTNSSYACKRIKGGFLKRIAKKTFGSPGSADSLSSVNPSAAVNLGRWRRTSTPIYNLYWLILFICWGNWPISHKKADIHGSQNYLGIRIMRGKVGLNLHSPRVSHSVSKYKGQILADHLIQFLSYYSVTSYLATNQRPGYHFGKCW